MRRGNKFNEAELGNSRGFEGMSSTEAEREWRAAQLFMAKGPSPTLEFLVEDAKAQLFALRAQALDGPCPSGQDGYLTTDPALRRKQEAWAALGAMPQVEAKRKFVEFLTTVLPEWKAWSDTHGEALRVEQQEGSAERILRLFKAKTGVGFPSRL
ncbi:hypothetical protein MPTK1_1g15410 [Marchantia polymorpha subsp. ruderalis]|uniref:ACB domain-containing protein n=2 Tax=Marchantia polymorpha TaxID=3197 RepID=A0AAF6AQG3_MARPO|nr:hypothetical protein MARPO_0033s0120 [Marchantia polymorpha]BBM98683.1 hypothetical protein Mp_1g15410 [Marchantia polymorpha subsp. ruderalis]|eukprot:PTQ41725.1 hypothetical protein MARPO_0033s0120 [Marchantia polymorpha]